MAWTDLLGFVIIIFLATRPAHSSSKIKLDLGLTESEFIDREYDKLSWFVHITDTHVSSWEDETRQTQLQQFVVDTLSHIRPELVMCGGDLTEAKSSDMVADQDISEWRQYRDIVDTRWNSVPWLDIR